MAQSNLRYLDDEGRINFWNVPYKKLNRWLSVLNGNTNVSETVENINRGSVIEELEQRRNKDRTSLMERGMGVFVDRGITKDWREYTNEDGYTHLEELIIHQPPDWRKQAREYVFVYKFNLRRQRKQDEKPRAFNNHLVCEDGNTVTVEIPLDTPILVALFHPDIPRTTRYGPLNFLLSYGVKDPLPDLFRKIHDGNLCDKGRATEVQQLIKDAISPLDYFFEFQRYIQSYRTDCLADIGERVGIPRLMLIKELDFCNIIGQRLAKHVIKKEIVHYMWSRTQKDDEICAVKYPISLVFAGPSGNGKTELAEELAKLLNKPNDTAFHKVDCGKLRDANEMFGMSGPYHGSEIGSALNNFVLTISQDQGSFGVVLLDEIEKARENVIHALYQVIDKGEWTNKKLLSSREATDGQTSVVSCRNIIFVMTTNAADSRIIQYAQSNKHVYTVSADDLDLMAEKLQLDIRRQLQHFHPFTSAFIGRISAVVPFLPMSNTYSNENLLNGEMMAVAKLLIEREQEKLSSAGQVLRVNQKIPPAIKHEMAQIIVEGAIPEAGVRSIQMRVGDQMGKRMLHAQLLESGGIKTGCDVLYHTADGRIGFRMVSSGEPSDLYEEDRRAEADLFG